MGNAIEQQICEAIDTIVSKRVSDLKFDKTVRATIVQCLDASIGKYKVKYQDSTITAYSTSPQISYRNNTQVYVEIPSSDYDKPKLIIGTVKKLGEEYLGQVLQVSKKFTPIGTNLVVNNELIQFCTYKPPESIDLLTVQDIDLTALENYKTDTTTFKIGMTVKTSIPTQQRSTKGNYGMQVTAVYYNSVYKDLQTKQLADSERIYRTYILDVNNMLGDPYAYVVPDQQEAYFEIDGNNLEKIENIRVFCQNFPKQDDPNDIKHQDDIFLSNFIIQFVEPLTQEELNGVSLKLTCPNGDTILNTSDSTDNTKYIKAILKVKGNEVNQSQQDVQYYWFKRDTRVDQNNFFFNSYGGYGWKCLNQYKMEEEAKNDDGTSTQSHYFIPASSIYKVLDATATETTYKCVAVYNELTFSDTIIIKRKDINRKFGIKSSTGQKFYFDTGKTTLTCWYNRQNNIRDDFVYYWAERTPNNIYRLLDQHGPQLIDRKVNISSSIVTYQCSIFNRNETQQLGMAEISLSNGIPEGQLTLIINNGSQVFKYNGYGISPASNATQKKDRIDVLPLSFDIYDDKGELLTPVNDQEKVKQCEIKWIIPYDENKTLIRPPIDNNIYPVYTENILSSSENRVLAPQKSIKNTAILPFTIAYRYNITAIQNDIHLQVNFQGQNLSAVTNFSFVKEGQIGTNGTKYIARIAPYVENGTQTYDDFFIFKDKIIGCREDFFSNYDQTGETDQYIPSQKMYFKDVGKQPFTSQIWDGNNNPIYDYRKGIRTSDTQKNTTEKNKLDNLATKIKNGDNLTEDQEKYLKELEEQNITLKKCKRESEAERNEYAQFLNNIAFSKYVSLKWSLLNLTKNNKTSDGVGNFSIDKETGKITFGNSWSWRESNVNTETGEYQEIPDPIIIKTTFKTKYLSQLAREYYATYSLPSVIRTPSNIEYYPVISGGYKDCLYNSDGTRGKFSPDNFQIRLFSNESNSDGYYEDKTEKIKNVYWWASWNGIDNSLYKKDNTNKWKTESDFKFLIGTGTSVAIEPPSFLDSQTTTKYSQNFIKIQCQVEGGGVYIIIYPIHLYLNQYDKAAMNDWDGTSIKLDQNEGYILAPQIGAGYKDDADNTFTGITIGRSFGVSNDNVTKKNAQIGLMGFNHGKRSLFLDAETGNAKFGLPGSGQINIDPSGTGIAPIGSIYSWNYFEEYNDKGYPSKNWEDNIETKPDNQRINRGMLIDFTTPSIRFGSGNFVVDEKGHLTARGGGDIAGWEISDDWLRSPDKRTILYSGTKNRSGDTQEDPRGGNKEVRIQVKEKATDSQGRFRVFDDGSFYSIFGTIGGWNIGATQLWATSKNLYLDSSGSIWGGPGSSSDMTSGNARWYIDNNGNAKFNHIEITDMDGNPSKFDFTWEDGWFKVDREYGLRASLGTIGGWTLSQNGFANFTGETPFSVFSKAAQGVDAGLMFGGKTYGAANFAVTPAGQMKAISGDIANFKIYGDQLKGGKIVCNQLIAILKGTIGSWDINGTSLESGTSKLNPDGISCGGLEAPGAKIRSSDGDYSLDDVHDTANDAYLLAQQAYALAEQALNAASAPPTTG